MAANKTRKAGNIRFGRRKYLKKESRSLHWKFPRRVADGLIVERLERTEPNHSSLLLPGRRHGFFGKRFSGRRLNPLRPGWEILVMTLSTHGAILWQRK
jgi:hypothetical protein